MTTYLCQLITNDAEFQLRTEVTATTVEQLQHEAREMVKRFPAMIGQRYIVAKYTKRVGAAGSDCQTLKTGTITG